MNEFEFDKAMEYLGYEKVCGRYITKTHYCLYHSGKYYAIVEGRTPYELALLIREKYDNNIYKIRVNGNHQSEYPKCDVYEYHIDTLEGLVVFLLETRNYYSMQQNVDEEIDRTLNSLYKNLLRRVDTKTSVYDWMFQQENGLIFFKTVLSTDSYLDFRLRKKIETFDNVVNPFCNKTLNIDDNNFAVFVDNYQRSDSFGLIDKDTGISLITRRKKNSFSLQLHIPTKSPFQIDVYHYFDSDGELIIFDDYSENGLSRMEYNLTNETFDEHYGEKKQVTRANKEFVIRTLDEYIDIVKNIIMKNKHSQKDEKKFTLTKHNSK